MRIAIPFIMAFMVDNFIHLRMHSEYSVTEGAARLSDGGVIDRAAELGMPALGLTDAGNTFGAIKFFLACRARGIKPIIGCEILVEDDQHPPYYLLALCANEEGYRNINQLLTRGYSNNNGVIKSAWLKERHQGIILLSGGQRGNIAQAILADDHPRAQTIAAQWKECMGDRFYIEVWRECENDNGLAAAISVLAAAINIPVVATHPVQCARESDLQMLEIRRCIAHNWLLRDSNRRKPFSDKPHLLSTLEMQQRFSDMPEALENSQGIAQRCNFTYQLGQIHLPKIPTQAGETASDAILRQAQEGLQARAIPADKTEIYQKRLQYELTIINTMGFADYYLIVADFVSWAKQQNIPVGPGRGSGSASMVAYALKITEIDPIFYGLLFERFLNPDRHTLPDFDIDFCVNGRDRVIEYVNHKYGADRVAQIVTFGQIGARSAVRDVGRVMGLPYPVVDKIARLIPNTPDITIDKALSESPQIKDEISNNEEIAELIDLSKKVEGLPRNIGTHAGGILIAPESITNYCALYAAADTNSMVSQMDMKDIEKIGLVKFDFLGLKTLTILHHAEHLLRHANITDDDFSLENIPLDDSRVYSIYAKGDTMGVFQCESKGMRQLMQQLIPNHFNEIIALMALYRPGPLNSGMVRSYIERKHGRENTTYVHASLKQSLSETYGVWVYQEQVMQTAQQIADYSLGDADYLRRAMGKKQPEIMEKQRQQFTSQAAKLIGKEQANSLFNDIAKFAEYGFNKAHAAAYALISYRTAYLKTHYPAALYAAVMSADYSDTDRLRRIVECARVDKVCLLPPDINTSCGEFNLTDNNEIIYGLQSIKGLGSAVINDIITARDAHPFKDLFDFCRRLAKIRPISRAALESLAGAGAFDSLHANRAAVHKTIPIAIESGGQSSSGLFSSDSINVLADEPFWKKREIFINEQKALGFSLSGSFYSLYKDFTQDITRQSLSNFNYNAPPTRIAGILIDTLHPRAMRRQNTAIIVLEDDTFFGFEVIADDTMIKNLGTLKKGQDMLIFDIENINKQRVYASAVYTLDQFISRRARAMTIHCSANTTAAELQNILSTAQDSQGRCHIKLNYDDDAISCCLSLGDKWRPSQLLCANLRHHTSGISSVKLGYEN